MISSALDAVGKQNGVNAQMIALAQQGVQTALAASQTGAAQPQFIPTGGAGGGGGGGGGISGAALGGAIGGRTGAAIGGVAARVLNSTNNPLKGIFR